MAHTHSVIDSDNHFIINPVTREITNSSKKVKLMQGDHASEVFTFEIPRYVDGHDMSLCDKIAIHYVNIGQSGSNPDVHIVEDARVDDAGKNLIFSWLIYRTATKYPGTLNFLIKFSCVTDGIIEYQWNTDIFKGIMIATGMDNEETLVEEYSDVLQKWKDDILSEIHPGAQSDWNENDETSPAFVKNRPFYTGEPVFTEIIPEQTYTLSSHGSVTIYEDQSGTYPYSLEVDKDYTVVYNGTTYELTSNTLEGFTYVGDASPLTTGGEPSVPFAIVTGMGILQILDYTGNTEVTFKISAFKAEIKKIDTKYIPELPEYMSKTDPVGYGSFSLNRKADTTVGANSHAEGDGTTASGIASHAEGNGTTASGAASHAEGFNTIASELTSHAEGFDTEANARFSHAEGAHTIVSTTDISVPSYSIENGMGRYGHAEGICTVVTGGHGAHSEGFKTLSSGDSSHAEGYNTKASSNASHAEGYNTKASGDSSHAEGYNTEASSNASHAEGHSTVASGVYSHAEGYDTTASGNYSHVEGAVSEASGVYSHAEGYNTTASGESAHSEGYYTVASSDHQHVQGKYNIEDSDGVYAHIVGNGTDYSKRSNCHTIDWNGNAWFSGTIESKSIIIHSSTADSTKKFRITVDDSGTISATEVT